MAIDIFSIPKKETINRSLQAKSIMVVGKSKAGKSSLAAQAPRPIFLMTENGGEGLTGFTPVPIPNWATFKQVVNQLCTSKGREQFDTVVIDTYTNLILLLDKFIGNKLSTDKESYDFGSDVDYGKGIKQMKNELGVQLQKLANQGYLMLNIVHAEDKTDFTTQKKYIGTSLSDSLYGVAEKFVDQIIYLRADINSKGEVEHNIWFNPKGGFAGAGGRFTPKEDYVYCSYENLEKALFSAIDNLAATKNINLTTTDKPSVTIEEPVYDFNAMMKEFQDLVGDLMTKNQSNASKITGIVEKYLGHGRKVSDCTPTQSEQIDLIIQELKELN